MALTTAPCTDTLDERFDKIWGEQSSHEHSHDHQHSHEDDCPPLCSCNCCGVVLTDYFIDFGFKESIPFIKIADKNESSYPNFIPSYFDNIWQPPQI